MTMPSNRHPSFTIHFWHPSQEGMNMRLLVWGATLAIAAALTLPVIGQQEKPAQERREQQADQMAQQNRNHEPHMAAALEHLRQAQEELEKAAPNKGGHREKAMQLVQQAESQVEQGIQYYDQHVSPAAK
jgi:uncharacterized protein HemX